MRKTILTVGIDAYLDIVKNLIFFICSFAILLSSASADHQKVVHQVIKDGEIHISALEREISRGGKIPVLVGALGAITAGTYSTIPASSLLNSIGAPENLVWAPFIAVAAAVITGADYYNDHLRFRIVNSSTMLQHAQNTCTTLGYKKIAWSSWLNIKVGINVSSENLLQYNQNSQAKKCEYFRRFA